MRSVAGETPAEFNARMGEKQIKGDSEVRYKKKRNLLSAPQKLQLCKWFEEHVNSLNGKEVSEVIHLAQKDLGFIITESNLLSTEKATEMSFERKYPFQKNKENISDLIRQVSDCEEVVRNLKNRVAKLCEDLGEQFEI